jgi:signal transduction histidine kinase
VPRPDNRVVVGERRLQGAIGLLFIGLIAITAVVFVSPAIGVAVVHERLDLVINTGATIAALAIAAIAWARYRVTREAFAFAQAAAFLALGTVNGLVLMVVVMNRAAELGYTLDDPGPMPVIAFLMARFVAAGVLLVGGLAALRHLRLRPRWPVVLVLAPTILLVGFLTILRRLEPASPLTTAALEHLQRLPSEAIELSLASAGLLGVQLGIGVMFLVGAWFAYRTTLRDDRPADAYLAIGLIVAAASQVHFAVNPGAYVGLVTTGDLLLIAFYAALLSGVIVQSRTDVRELREANVELRRLREADVHRTLLEERARLAREVHDGLAQDLWYARLKQGRLVDLIEDGEERQLATDVMEAIDAGIADARQSVMAMRAGSTDAPLLQVVERYVDDFSDRFAIDVRFERVGEPPALPARMQAEILRIVQEALNNVRKHADATVVKVSAHAERGGLRLVIGDNGRGFMEDRVEHGFGFESMRERAEAIGAQLEIDSRPSDGTRVSILVPAPVEAG